MPRRPSHGWRLGRRNAAWPPIWVSRGAPCRQRWCREVPGGGPPAGLTSFAGTPDGVAWLHRMVSAAHFSITLRAAGGTRLVSEFLELSGLSAFVGVSDGALHSLNVALETALVGVAAEQRTALAQGMAPRQVTVCEDETFHPKKGTYTLPGVTQEAEILAQGGPHEQPIPHPQGEPETVAVVPHAGPVAVDTFGGRVHVEWDARAAVTPLGQLPFFTEFLRPGGRFDAWVESCQLKLTSPNAPSTRDVLGTAILAVLSAHQRYAHISALRGDAINAALPGMEAVVSEDSVRRNLGKLDEADGVAWLQKHLDACVAPVLDVPWILDTDVTVKPLYGHQEGAVKGDNPHRPGRPSHTDHTYFVAGLHLILDMAVLAGNQTSTTSSSTCQVPGRMFNPSAFPIKTFMPFSCRASAP